METINNSEFSEEKIYIWKCPKCCCYNHTFGNPDYKEKVECEECNTEFKIVDN